MSAVDDLIEALQVLPGVGPKSAQRMALHLLLKNKEGADQLATSLGLALTRVQTCQVCRNLTESSVCRLCQDPARDQTTLCVVESPADIIAIEQAGGFNGLYFVLNGRLSPLDGVGPEELGMQQLRERVNELPLTELILATNPTVEGEATAHFIAQMVTGQVGRVTRIAHGVPLGGEIEYTDGGTLAHALQGRRNIA